ncbi:hypothetical protein [Acidiphilium cryptum]|uniref:hypothetical protein n=1 Tax=Acidiphilium cryptum TaxID=524 RepID=UPI0012DD5C5B|nr:hypothetical protein [Acidiphilium cryptum]
MADEGGADPLDQRRIVKLDRREIDRNRDLIGQDRNGVGFLLGSGPLLVEWVFDTSPAVCWGK